jgi:hypothetical protein
VIQQSSTPAPAASVAAPLSFAHESPGVSPSAGSTLVVTLVLIVLAAAALWAVRRRFPSVGKQAEPPGARWRVTQRLRIGPACTAAFVVRGDVEWMVVESRGGVSVTRMDSLSQGETA